MKGSRRRTFETKVWPWIWPVYFAAWLIHDLTQHRYYWVALWTLFLVLALAGRLMDMAERRRSA